MGKPPKVADMHNFVDGSLSQIAKWLKIRSIWQSSSHIIFLFLLDSQTFIFIYFLTYFFVGMVVGCTGTFPWKNSGIWVLAFPAPFSQTVGSLLKIHLPIKLVGKMIALNSFLKTYFNKHSAHTSIVHTFILQEFLAEQNNLLGTFQV